MENMTSLEFGTCVKNKESEILFQNDICKTSCGDMEGLVCNKGCLTSSMADEGMTLLKNSFIGDRCVDALVINNGTTLTTLIYPKHKYEIDRGAETVKLLSYGLSKSEVIIFLKVMEGKKNSQIKSELFISKSTLKTHINNIYKKLPDIYQHYKKRS